MGGIEIPYALKYPNRIIEEKWITHDNIAFYSVKFPVLEDVKLVGKIMIVHGWCEHTKLYYRLMEYLTSIGYECIVFDQRGFGLTSPGKYRGRPGKCETTLVTDLNKMIEIFFFEGDDTDLPCHLLGHSMGGAVILRYMQIGKHRNMIKSYISTAPLIQTNDNTVPYLLLIYLARFMSIFFPYHNYTAGSGLLNRITECKDWEEYIKNDPLSKGEGTFRQINYLISRGQNLLSSASTTNTSSRLLILHGPQDLITDYEALRRFMVLLSIEDKTLIPIHDIGHAPFIEREEKFQEVVGHIKKHLDNTHEV